MKILVTGSNGLLGQKLMKLLLADGTSEIIAIARGTDRLNLNGDYIFESVDLIEASEVAEVMDRHRPDVIINTAAMTNVDECELNQEACWKANEDGSKKLDPTVRCDLCREQGIRSKRDLRNA